MPAFGILLTWLGYSVFYYGFDIIQGGNDSFVSLVWPGRYTVAQRDQPHAGNSAATNNSAPSLPANVRQSPAVTPHPTPTRA